MGAPFVGITSRGEMQFTFQLSYTVIKHIKVLTQNCLHGEWWGLLESQAAMFSRWGPISFSNPESLKPIRGVKSLIKNS